METCHNDEPDRVVQMPDGRLVRNLTPDEYAATYSEGTPCHAIPDDVLAQAVAAAVDPQEAGQ